MEDFISVAAIITNNDLDAVIIITNDVTSREIVIYVQLLTPLSAVVHIQ